MISALDLAADAVGTASGMLMGVTCGTAGVAYIGFGALQDLVGITPALVASVAVLRPAAAPAVVALRRHRTALS